MYAVLRPSAWRLILWRTFRVNSRETTMTTNLWPRTPSLLFRHGPIFSEIKHRVEHGLQVVLKMRKEKVRDFKIKIRLLFESNF